MLAIGTIITYTQHKLHLRFNTAILQEGRMLSVTAVWRMGVSTQAMLPA